MLEFIKIAYCVSIPLLLLFSFIPFSGWNKYALNLISLSNILLIGYSFYLGWQLLALYQFAKQFGIEYKSMSRSEMGMMIKLSLIFLLPFLSLHAGIRRNRIFTLALLVLLFWVFPPFSWNVFAIGYKIPAYFCLMCSAYALLWLLNRLPYQSHPK